MGAIILWTIICILFVTNPGLFFLGVVAFVVYQGLKSYRPDQFTSHRTNPPGSDQKEEEQAQTSTPGGGRFEFIDNDDDPEVVEIREELNRHIRKNQAQADEDIMAQAEKEYAAKKRAEELGRANR